MTELWVRLRRWWCALNRHRKWDGSSDFYRINEGPWICERCGGIDERKER